MNISVSMRPISEDTIVNKLKNEVFKIDGVHVSIHHNFSVLNTARILHVPNARTAAFLVAFPVLFQTAGATDAAHKIIVELKKITDSWPSSVTQIGHIIKPSTQPKRKQSKEFRPALLIGLPEKGATDLVEAFIKDSDKIVAALQPILAKGVSENLPPEEPKIPRKYENLRPEGNERPRPRRFGKCQL